MEVVVISDGAAVIVNKPSVTPVGGAVNESFSSESTCSVNNEDEESGAANPYPRGPFSAFRERRAGRIAARVAHREQMQRAEDDRKKAKEEERRRVQEERKKAEEEERRRVQEERKKAEEAIPERLIEPDFEFLRAGRISATVSKNESNSYGMGLTQVPRNKNMVKIDVLVKEGEGHDSLLCQSPLREGDILKMVNNKVVTEFRPVMLQLMKMDGPVTILVETPAPQGNPAVVQAFCRKPSPETTIGIEFQLVDHSTTQNAFCRDPSGTQEVTAAKLLQIKSVNPDGFLAHSALSPGDFVLAINEKPCTNMSAEDATAMILESELTVNILALNPKLAQEHCSPTRAQLWMRRARRTSVGVAGGTMLGLGLIMPFGEVLMVGGVSVLGMEFEAPIRVVRSARNLLQNAVADEKNPVATEKLQQMESVAGDNGSAREYFNENDESSDESENNDEKVKVVLRNSFLTRISQQQQRVEEPIAAGDVNDTSDETFSINDCWSQANVDANIDNMYDGKEHDTRHSPSGTRQFLKNVGRHVVLPFLDHVVGDQKEDDIAEKLESKPANNEEIPVISNVVCGTNSNDSDSNGHDGTISNTLNDNAGRELADFNREPREKQDD